MFSIFRPIDCGLVEGKEVLASQVSPAYASVRFPVTTATPGTAATVGVAAWLTSRERRDQVGDELMTRRHCSQVSPMPKRKSKRSAFRCFRDRKD